jgi:pimeloyl-ACP methyl ester carboxylesterase
MKVPVDWNNPGSGKDASIQLSRVLPKSGNVPTRTLASNPGGPGASGLVMPLYFALLRPQVADTAQLIGFDPRGSTYSSNISCWGAPTTPGDVRDRDRARLDLVARASKLTSDYCHVASDNLINYVNTEQTVKDIELIRHLTGPDKLDFVGYSGGTWMGAYYATYFPQHTGRFVLDSNADFTASWDKTFNAQPMSFERRFRQDFAPWAAKYEDFFGDWSESFGAPRADMGSTADEVIAYYEKLRAQYKADPVNLLGLVFIDANAIDSLIAQAMYSKTDFDALTKLLITLEYFHDLYYPPASGSNATSKLTSAAALFDKLPAGVKNLLTPRQRPLSASPDSFGATFYAITCNDTAWAGGRGTAERLSGQLGPKYPLIGWGVNFNPCWDWDRPALNLKQPTGEGVPQVLMIQSEHDPATAYEAAASAHRNFAGSVMVTVKGEGDHGIYGGDNGCVNTIVERFLSSGDLPAGDTTCQGAGLPAPVGANAASSGSSGTTAKSDLLHELSKIENPMQFAIKGTEVFPNR